MKAITTLEIIILLVVLVVTALFVLSWLGLGTNPLDWFKKQTIKNTFCGEIQERTNCQFKTVRSVDDLEISPDDTSTKIKKSDIGTGSSKEFATYGEICGYLQGYQDYNNKNKLQDCLKKLCGCKFTS